LLLVQVLLATPASFHTFVEQIASPGEGALTIGASVFYHFLTDFQWLPDAMLTVWFIQFFCRMNVLRNINRKYVLYVNFGNSNLRHIFSIQDPGALIASCVISDEMLLVLLQSAAGDVMAKASFAAAFSNLF